MKTLTALFAAVALLTGCQHGTATEPQLRQQMAGTWWSGDRWITEPFAFVTFFPDGRFTRSSTNSPIASMSSGYWRLSHTNVITFSVKRDAIPADTLLVFRVDQITDHLMVFTNATERLRISFTR